MIWRKLMDNDNSKLALSQDERIDASIARIKK
jgi:hypothetical protein